MQKPEIQKGWTMIEILTVCVIMGLIFAFAIPSYMQARRVVYEDNAMSRLQRIALAESRHYSEYGRFGDFTELVEANYLPRGYSTVYKFTDPMSQSSVLPFIDRYSLAFNIPNNANSIYYKVDAIPVGYNKMGLRTFNINLFVTGQIGSDSLIQDPPVRVGLDPDSPPVTNY